MKTGFRLGVSVFKDAEIVNCAARRTMIISSLTWRA